jgi:hypothetical protein
VGDGLDQDMLNEVHHTICPARVQAWTNLRESALSACARDCVSVRAGRGQVQALALPELKSCARRCFPEQGQQA